MRLAPSDRHRQATVILPVLLVHTMADDLSNEVPMADALSDDVTMDDDLSDDVAVIEELSDEDFTSLIDAISDSESENELDDSGFFDCGIIRLAEAEAKPDSESENELYDSGFFDYGITRPAEADLKLVEGIFPCIYVACNTADVKKHFARFIVELLL